MYDLIKSLAALLVQPLPIFAALCLLALLLWFARYQKAAIWLSSLSLVTLLLASWAPVAESLLSPLEQAYPEYLPDSDNRDIHAIVVLGGGWSPEGGIVSPVGRLGDSSARRLMEGVRLWHALADAPLVVTGTSRRASEPSNALGYSEAAQALGMPESALTLLEWPTDTGQEARAVAEHLGDDARIVLVTSASHMPRAMLYFERAGLDAIAAPTHYLTGGTSPGRLAYWVPSAHNLRKSERAIYEYLGLVAAVW